MGQDIGALDSLRVEAEDVVDAQDGDLRGGGPSHVCLETIELDIFALWFVVLGNDRRDSEDVVRIDTLDNRFNGKLTCNKPRCALT